MCSRGVDSHPGPMRQSAPSPSSSTKAAAFLRTIFRTIALFSERNRNPSRCFHPRTACQRHCFSCNRSLDRRLQSSGGDLDCLGAGEAAHCAGEVTEQDAVRANRISSTGKVAITQCMLLDTRADPAAAGREALAAAASTPKDRSAIVEALLEDPHVDGAAFAIERLTRRALVARSTSERMLMRQSALLRALALRVLSEPAVRSFNLSSCDATAMAAAAWRRRRAAILSY